MVRGTGQGVGQLHQEFFPNFETPICGDLSEMYCNPRCWVDTNRVGQSISPSLALVQIPVYLSGIYMVFFTDFIYICSHARPMHLKTLREEEN